MKNKLIDLNNHLFTQLERLNDEDLQNEIERSKSISGIAKDIVSVGRLVLDAEVAKNEYNLVKLPLLADKSHEA